MLVTQGDQVASEANVGDSGFHVFGSDPSGSLHFSVGTDLALVLRNLIVELGLPKSHAYGGE